VRETQAADVRIGNTVEARTPALPERLFKGKVSAILPEVNATTRTLKARVELANPRGELKPGMFVTVNFASSARKEALLVPSEAVLQTGKRTVVIVAQGDGKFAPVDVETGIESNGETEIRKGLEAGQKVVLSGQFLIDSEASLRGTLSRMGEAQAASAPSGAYKTQGKIEAIGKDEVTLSHEPVPELKWPSMTMAFRMPATGVPKDLKVGDKVDFEFRQGSDGRFEISAIAKAKP
jgi:membrane fusion protein, copper/silver efflux system